MRILVALGDARSGGHLVSYLRLLARDVAVEVRVIHVVEQRPGLSPDHQVHVEAAALVADAVHQLCADDIDASGAVLTAQLHSIAELLADEAARCEAELITLNARRSWDWRSTIRRGVREQLLRRMDIPIALVASPPFSVTNLGHARKAPPIEGRLSGTSER